MLDNFRLRTKLLLGFLIMIIIFAGGLGIIGYQLFQIRTTSDKIMMDTKKISAAFEVSELAEKKYNTFINLYFTEQNDTSLTNEYFLVKTDMLSAIVSLKILLKEDVEKQNMEELEKINTRFDELYESELVNAWQLQDIEKMKSIISEAQDLQEKLRTNSFNFILNAKSSTNLNIMEINKVLGTLENNFMITLGISLALGILIAFLFTRGITRPINKLAEASSKIASGDLTGEKLNIGFCKELKNLSAVFNNMQDNLRELISKITDTSNNLAAGSEELAASAGQVGDSSQQIAASIEEMSTGTQRQQEDTHHTAETIKLSVESISNINKNIQAMVEQTKAVNKKASIGSELMENAQAQMDQIAKRTSLIHTTVTNLDERSGEIGKIVEMITNISEQTNLLALNAAIEAARAGEHGRGFAVVAEEVRKLAEQSSHATKDITNLIKEIQAETGEACVSIAKGVDEVEMGKEVMDKSGKHFQDISTSITEITAHIESIAAVIERITKGATDLLKKVENIAAVTEEASAGMEEASAATQEQNAAIEEITASAHELAETAEFLQESTSTFKVNNDEEENHFSLNDIDTSDNAADKI